MRNDETLAHEPGHLGLANFEMLTQFNGVQCLSLKIGEMLYLSDFNGSSNSLAGRR
jgi:hypothetical protein